jgi:hypothetical protein
MIKLKCNNCNHQIGVPEKYAGKRVRCPKCKAPIRVPESVGKTGTQEPELIKFRCPSCNQKIGIAPDYAGKRVRCAKCKNPLIVPQTSSQSGRLTVKDETKVLRAGQEQHSADKGIWDDLGGLDELRLAEANAPERQMEPNGVNYESGDSELSAYTDRLPQSGAYAEREINSGRPRKKRALIFIGAACVLVLLLAGIVIWSARSDLGSIESEMEDEFYDVQKFAEDYIFLLNKGEIDKAKALLSPELKVNIEKSDFEKLTKHLSRSNMAELKCWAKSLMEKNTEGRQFCLYYEFRYEGQKQRILLLVSEIDKEFAVTGIAAREPFGEALSVGRHSFAELRDMALSPTATKIQSIFTRFFCGFAVLMVVVCLVQAIALWNVYEKAGEPGWAILVPFYNMWVLAEVGGKPGWLGLLMIFSGFIPVIGPLAGLVLSLVISIGVAKVVLSLVISIGVAKAFNRSVGFGVGLTLVPFVFYPILAFTSD